MGKLFLRTFGCQMNEYDSGRIADLLRSAEGLDIAERPEEADVIVFNTCSVREKAQEKVFADLGRVKHLKRAKPGLMIAVGGCVASQEGGAIVRRAPYVDVVFGPQTLHRLPELLARRRDTGEPQVDISFPEIEKFDHLPPARVEGARHQLPGDREVRPPAAGPRRGCIGIRLDHGRLQQVLQLLRRALHARRGSVAAVRGRRRRNRLARSEGGHPPRPERECVARNDRRRAGGFRGTAVFHL
jgi:hypothetical protein